ncbi:hypothetical protein ACS0TY_008136 [Phlomoides rotata]
MGGRGAKKKGSNATPGSQPRISSTLREKSSGKKQGNVNAKTMCKLDHLKDLAVWAAAEASVPSLGAFFGERLAATNEALGIRADPSLFVCERCESILQPGHNCVVRIEKNKSKVLRRLKNPNLTSQNNVVYKCNFCSHRNLMRGTSKGYLKEICPPKPKPALKLKAECAVEKHHSLMKATTATTKKVDFVALSPLAGQNFETSSPATPNLSLLDSKRRKRNRSTKKVVESEPTAEADKSLHVSSKRRKKSWTSLKEIAESSWNDVGNKTTNLSIPFFI